MLGMLIVDRTTLEVEVTKSSSIVTCMNNLVFKIDLDYGPIFCPITDRANEFE